MIPMAGEQSDKAAKNQERYSSSVPPFRFIDSFTQYDATTCRTVKSITRNEWCLVKVGKEGWIFPQTLLLECMAQTAGTFDEILQNRTPPKKILVSRIRDIRFMRDPKPGDQLIMEARLLKVFAQQAAYFVVAKIDEQKIAEANFYFARL
ncbi:hypothetical protein K8S19_13400 [bacterium]|nr:hypothetical protein [bacterium]